MIGRAVADGTIRLRGIVALYMIPLVGVALLVSGVVRITLEGIGLLLT